MFLQTSNQATYMTLSSHESGNRKKCSWAIKLKGLLSMTHFLQLEPPAKGFTDIHQLGTKCSNTRAHVGHLTFKPLHGCFCFVFSVLLVLSWEGRGNHLKKKKNSCINELLWFLWCITSEKISKEMQICQPPSSNVQNFKVMIHALGF